MSDMDPVPHLPPPRWKASGRTDPFVRNLMFLGVALVGMLAGCSCCWSGLIHSTVEDVINAEGGSSYTPPPDYRDHDAPVIVRDPHNEIVPGAKPRIPVRKGLIQRPDPKPETPAPVDDGSAPDSRDAVPNTPAKQPNAGPSEEEMFGVR